MRTVLVASAMLLALGACSKSGVHREGDTVTVTSEDGTKATIGAAAPSHLPDYVKVYPGAKVTASVDNGVAGTLAMEVSDPPDKVLDFYRHQAEAAKLSSTTEINQTGQGGGHMMVFTDPGGKRTLSVTAQVTDGKTQVGVTYGG